jgi:hypothetical protein
LVRAANRPTDERIPAGADRVTSDPLADLHSSGQLSDEDFAAATQQVLAGR